MTDRLNSLLDQLAHPMPGITLGLERMHNLLNAMDNPERLLPPVVHVAGTNGKASTIAFMRAMLEAAGLRVHVYNSPELVRFHERIRLAGILVEDAPLLAALERVMALTEHHPATFFEATTAAAFQLFSDTPADIVLLETGLGGRLDATNVLEAPMLTVITPISMDHMEYLGDSLAKIAAEKAGIIKPGAPCVISRQAPEALTVLTGRAEEQNAQYFTMGQSWQYEQQNDGICFKMGDIELQLPYPSLAGAHQWDNAGTAIAAAVLLREQGLPLSHHDITEGLAQARLPGRLQPLTRGRLADQLPDGGAFWVDSGHNAAAGKVLAEWLAAYKDRPVWLICGMMKDKDSDAFLAALAPYVDRMTAVTLSAHGREMPADRLARTAQIHGITAHIAANLEAAVQEALAETQPLIIVGAGSCVLAGELLRLNGTLPD